MTQYVFADLDSGYKYEILSGKIMFTDALYKMPDL
jgi:hypothetical protein